MNLHSYQQGLLFFCMVTTFVTFLSRLAHLSAESTLLVGYIVELPINMEQDE
jgi:hypothetical protein